MESDFSQTLQTAKSTAGSLVNKAANSVTTETKATLDTLKNLVGESGQTLSNLTIDLNQSVSGLNKATTTLKTSVLEATGGAVKTITETSHQAANAFKETTVQATGALNGATDIAVEKLNTATSSITQTAEKTKFALDETLHKTERLSGAISHSVQEVVAASMKTWMAEHSIVSWIIAYPLWTIALLILVIFLCWSLLGAIAQLTQRMWLALLQAPLKLTQLLSKGAFQAFQSADASSLTKMKGQQDVQERLAKISSRLEALHQEQEVLMKEMRSMLVSKH